MTLQFDLNGIKYEVLDEYDKTCRVHRQNYFSQDVVELSEFVSYEGVNYRLTEIGMFAFMDSHIKEIKLPNGIIKIDHFAFHRCNELRDVHLPESLISIGDEVFYCCYELRKIQLPQSLTDIGTCCFEGSKNLQNIIIPDNVARIGTGAFDNCWELETVHFGRGLKDAGNSLFSMCKKLREMYLYRESIPYVQNLLSELSALNVNINIVQ